jgi:hypothetical protein
MALCIKSYAASPDEPTMPIVDLALVLLESAIFKIPNQDVSGSTETGHGINFKLLNMNEKLDLQVEVNYVAHADILDYKIGLTQPI